jgi:mono/diheme cytochrome c family protein
MKAFTRDNWPLLAGGVGGTIVALVIGRFTGMPPLFLIVLIVATALVAVVIFKRWTRLPLRGSGRLPGRKLAVSVVAAAAVVGLVVQAVPYGRSHTNPPVTAEPAWDSPRTRELAERACFDCHSNEVSWPWYSNVAPFSWAVTKHVKDGRNKVNYSEWDQPQREAEESAETITDGEMPPAYYLLTHSDARLTDAEEAELIAGFEATIGTG